MKSLIVRNDRIVQLESREKEALITVVNIDTDLRHYHHFLTIGESEFVFKNFFSGHELYVKQRFREGDVIELLDGNAHVFRITRVDMHRMHHLDNPKMSKLGYDPTEEGFRQLEEDWDEEILNPNMRSINDPFVYYLELEPEINDDKLCGGI